MELFAEKAYHQNVTICSRLTSTKLNLEVPVHQRYRLANPAGQPFNVTIPKPKLLIGCKDRVKDHRVSKIQICWPCVDFSKKWREIPYKWVSVKITKKNTQIMFKSLLFTIHNILLSKFFFQFYRKEMVILFGKFQLATRQKNSQLRW